ncbi:MAG: TonB-dependent receptor [Bdellovibrionaceae bacterium]|nr:TonB-dependent receptor [Pseudobdellovibrionaceae bacterium]
MNLDVSDQNFNSTDKIVIEHDEIQKSRANNLPALLASKANISISTNNVQPNSIYIRGGDSSHVLILVDGVPTYDASSPQRTINLFNMNLSKIKRIEVLKGSQSVIYGGQAMSGVIKIETFSDDSKNTTSVITDAAFGKHNGTRQTLSVDTLQNLTDETAFTANAYGLNARNASSVLDSDKLYPQTSGAADIGVQLKGEFENIFKLNYSRDNNQISNADFTNSKAVDTDDFYADTESAGGVWIFRKKDLFSLTVSQQKIDRAFDQEAAKTLIGTTTDEKYQGVLSNIRLDGLIFKSESAHLVAGIQYTTESMYYTSSGAPMTDDKTQYEGVYLKSDFLLPQNFLVEYGLRQENTKGHSLANSYHIGLIWNQMIKFEYSTGFKTPSLFQLYSSYGNPDLQPEASKNFSASIEHKFNDQFYSSLTYFDTQFENLIDYSFALSKYNNLAKTRTVGIESQTNANFMDGSLRLTLALGYQEPKDTTKNQWLVRRPLRSASLKASFDLTSDLNIGTEAIHTGEKLDKSGSKFLTVEDYTLVNIFGNYRISELVTAFARIENVENKNYQTTYGFFNQGSIYKLGAQFSF